MTSPVTLTIAQAAAALGISRQRVHVLIATGRLAATQTPSRYGCGYRWAISPAAIDAVRVRTNGWPKGRRRTPK